MHQKVNLGSPRDPNSVVANQDFNTASFAIVCCTGLDDEFTSEAVSRLASKIALGGHGVAGVGKQINEDLTNLAPDTIKGTSSGVNSI